MLTGVPNSGPAFEALMAQVDAKLAAEGVDIPGRPLLAAREVSVKFGLEMPLAGNFDNLPPSLRKNLNLSHAIKKWYDDAYGDRLKEDPCPGRTAFLLETDAYVMRIPRIFGQVQFVVKREFLHNRGISRGPVICNIVQLIDGVTPAKAGRLSDSALQAAADAFERALPALYILESTDHELLHIARGDVAVAVSNLMDRGERYGESKWASLQAAEKVIKAALALQGEKYQLTHGLQKLVDHLARVGVAIDGSRVVSPIQCTPAIRYGQESCTREEAIAAHHASLDLVNMLMAAGAKFSSGIGGPAG
jgi:hypothetical protein